MSNVRHATASVFVTRQGSDGVELLLIWHQKLKRWMIPGGHVEANEDPAEAGVREVLEETGLDIRVRSFGLTDQLGNFEDVEVVASPAWIAVEDIPAHKTEPEHQHIDFLYVGAPVNEAAAPEHGAQWFRASDLPVDEMFPATAQFAQLVVRAS